MPSSLLWAAAWAWLMIWGVGGFFAFGMRLDNPLAFVGAASGCAIVGFAPFLFLMSKSY
jgi:hypothetical protein